MSSIGWPKEKTPTARTGCIVTRFTENIRSSRNMIQTDKDDIFMVLPYSERSAKDMRENDLNGKGDAGVGAKSVYKILLYRDANKMVG